MYKYVPTAVTVPTALYLGGEQIPHWIAVVYLTEYIVSE